MTARSTLGALALNAGAVLDDHGWLRVLGAGTNGFPSLASANELVAATPRQAPPFPLVAFDVLGGRFAVDGGGLGGTPGEVHYWGPDTLGLGHSDFVWWPSATGSLTSTPTSAGMAGTTRPSSSGSTRPLDLAAVLLHREPSDRNYDSSAGPLERAVRLPR